MKAIPLQISKSHNTNQSVDAQFVLMHNLTENCMSSLSGICFRFAGLDDLFILFGLVTPEKTSQSHPRIIHLITLY